MSGRKRLSIGALGRLAAAGAAAFASTKLGGPDSNGLAVALSAVAVGYLTNRANVVEYDDLAEQTASQECHLQLALAGALRITLVDLEECFSDHATLFTSWLALLDAGLNDPSGLLSIVIPSNSDEILDASNPNVDQAKAYEELESLLVFWSAYQKVFDSTGHYPVVPPLPTERLPPQVQTTLRIAFLPKFQTVFQNLLAHNDSSYARRAFSHQRLHELLAESRSQKLLLKELLAKHSIPLITPEGKVAATRLNEVQFLRTENRALPILGRATEMSILHEWIESAAKVSVMVVVGAAGAGKTRLAFQLIDELGQSDWHAGFLSDADLAETKSLDRVRQTFVVIDYAATSAEPLKVWLEKLLSEQIIHPLRILLLEREADPKTGWLGFILDRSSTGQRISEMFSNHAPLRLGPLDSSSVQRAILRMALQQLGSDIQLPPEGDDLEFDRSLSDARWHNPLHLMMAACVVKQTGRLVHTLSLTSSTLANDIAERELERFRRFAPQGAPRETRDLLTHLACIATLCRTLTRAEFISVAKEEAKWLGIDFPGGPRVAAERVLEAIAAKGQPAPIQPDLIGEAAIVSALGKMDPDEGTATLLRCATLNSHRFAANVCFTIVRCCQDFETDEKNGPLSWLERLSAIADQSDLPLLIAIEAQLPGRTVVLREKSANICRLLLAQIKQSQDYEVAVQRGHLVALFTNRLAHRLLFLEHLQEAIQLSLDGMQLADQLSSDSLQDVYLRASARYTLCFAYFRSGQRQQALEISSESETLTNHLCNSGVATAVSLGVSLMLLRASILKDIGELTIALGMAMDCVAFVNSIAVHQPACLEPGLFWSYVTLAVLFCDCGFYEDGYAQIQIAIQQFRMLVLDRKDEYLESLIGTLMNASTILSKLCRSEEALSLQQEVVDLVRPLYRTAPSTFLHLYCSNLTNLANRLSEHGLLEESLAPALEANHTLEQVCGRDEASESDCARSYLVLAKRYREVNALVDALVSAEKAISLYEGLAKLQLSAYQADLAMILQEAALINGLLGRYDESLARSDEAIRHYTSLSAENPKVFSHMLAEALATAGTTLNNLQRYSDAIVYRRSSVEVVRTICQDSPESTPGLAQVLLELAVTYREDASYSEALEVLEEVFGLYHDLYTAKPEQYRDKVITTLGHFTSVYARDGNLPEAIENGIAMFAFTSGYDAEMLPALSRLALSSALAQCASALTSIRPLEAMSLYDRSLIEIIGHMLQTGAWNLVPMVERIMTSCREVATANRLEFNLPLNAELVNMLEELAPRLRLNQQVELASAAQRCLDLLRSNLG